MATKDAVGGYLVGLGAAVLVALLARTRARPAATTRWHERDGAKVILGIAVFLAVAALLNDLYFHPAAFAARLGHWIGGPGTRAYNEAFRGHAWLIGRAAGQLYLSVGWPLLAATAASAVYCAVRFPARSAFGLLPLLSFYVIVIGPIRMTAPRFYLPGLACLALLAGKGCADWSPWRRAARPLRAAGLAAVFGLSLLYCVGVDLEMLRDPRYEVERWFADNVEPGATVTALCPPEMAPRLQFSGYRYDHRWGRPTSARLLEAAPAPPDYLILSEKYDSDPRIFEPGFKRALLDGSLGYEVAARFDNRYLWPRRTLFGLAGWPAAKLSQVAPRQYVLSRARGGVP